MKILKKKHKITLSYHNFNWKDVKIWDNKSSYIKINIWNGLDNQKNENRV